MKKNTHRNNRNAPPYVLEAAFVFATIVGPGAGAQDVCQFDDGNKMSPDVVTSVMDYRVNNGSFSTVSTYNEGGNQVTGDITPHSSATPSKGAHSIIASGDIWNEQANAGIHRYVGTTTLDRDWYEWAEVHFEAVNGLPGYEAWDTYLYACHELGIDSSVHHISDEHLDKGGQTIPYCWDEPECDGPCGSGGIYYTIAHFPIDDEGDMNNRYFTGAVPGLGATRDLIEISVHELGHTLNVGHPDDKCSGEECASVMNQPGSKWDSTKQRYIHKHDVKCAYELNGEGRSLETYARSYNSTFGSESQPSGSVDVEQVALGYSFNGANYTTLQKRDDCWFWGPSAACISSGAPDMMSAGGPTVVAHMDSLPTYNRIYTSSYTAWSGTNTVDVTDTGFLDPEAKSRVQLSYSNNNFTSGYKYDLKRCGSMYWGGSFLTCSYIGNDTYVPVFSERPMEFARYYDSTLSDYVTVSAWANHNRDDDDYMELGYVSVGMVSSTTLPTPTSIGYRTGVSPAVACKNDFSGSYDCVVAFTDVDDGEQRVRTRRFSITRGTYYYTVSFDSTYYVNSGSTLGRTSSRMALFWDETNDRFVLVLRTHSSSSNQGLYAYTSTNGTSWSGVSGGVEGSTSHVGPNAPAYKTDTAGDDNRVIYAR